jgi:hypothetical protein
MERALAEGSTDMIGIARPLTAEPRLCADLISGQAAAAKLNLVDERLSTFAGIIQLQSIAAGQPIADFADPQVARETEEFMVSAGRKPIEKRADEAEGAYGEGC